MTSLYLRVKDLVRVEKGRVQVGEEVTDSEYPEEKVHYNHAGSFLVEVQEDYRVQEGRDQEGQHQEHTWKVGFGESKEGEGEGNLRSGERGGGRGGKREKGG